MGLAHLTNRTAEIGLLDGQKVSVRGLGFLDIFPIVTGHKEALTKLFVMYEQGGVSGMVDEVGTLVSLLAQAAPAALKQIVAAGCDEPDVSLVDRLPMAVQMEALEKIAALTFESEGGVKKVIEMVIRILTSLTAAAKNL